MHELIKGYNKKKTEIKNRLKEFTNLNDEDIFYELCFCILTPQSSGKKCWQHVLKLKEKDFRNNNFDPSSLVYPIRFYKNKSKYLLEAKNKFNDISNKIKELNNATELREWLLNNVKGLGLKESAHFMRNIGYRNIAILDRHVLRNLVKHKVIEKTPKSLTKKNYFEIENKFKKFSKEINIPMDELDLLFWSFETGEVFK